MFIRNSWLAISFLSSGVLLTCCFYPVLPPLSFSDFFAFSNARCLPPVLSFPCPVFASPSPTHTPQLVNALLFTAVLHLLLSSLCSCFRLLTSFLHENFPSLHAAGVLPISVAPSCGLGDQVIWLHALPRRRQSAPPRSWVMDTNSADGHPSPAGQDWVSRFRLPRLRLPTPSLRLVCTYCSPESPDACPHRQHYHTLIWRTA